MPLLEKDQALAAKIETTVGTAIAVAAADADHLVINPSIVQTISLADRESTDSYDGRASVPGLHTGRCTFTAEVFGGATAPNWAELFLPACGFVQGAADEVFTRTLGIPEDAGGATKMHTLTLGLFRGGVYEQIHGAMGTVNFRFTSGEIVLADFTFDGIYSSNADDTVPTVTYPTTVPVRFGKDTTFKVATVSTPCATANIDVGNTIKLIEDPTVTAGIRHAVVVGGKMTGRMNPEAATTTSKARRDALLARTEQALEIVVGAAENQVTWDGPKMQWLGYDPEADGILRDGMPFSLNRNVSAVNGALVITFA